MMFMFLLTLFVTLIAIFAYPKHRVKKIHESRMKVEDEREVRIKKRWKESKLEKRNKWIATIEISIVVTLTGTERKK
jgi:hypothetical protein